MVKVQILRGRNFFSDEPLWNVIINFGGHELRYQFLYEPKYDLPSELVDQIEQDLYTYKERGRLMGLIDIFNIDRNRYDREYAIAKVKALNAEVLYWEGVVKRLQE